MPFHISQLQGFNAGGSSKSLISIIQSAGLGASLVYALDAGDVTSYPGSGTTWSDTSGQGNHYSTSGPPTFNGTAGALDETNFWTFAGAQSFVPVTSPTSFDDTWAKANGTVTLMSVFFAFNSVLHGLCGDQSGNVANGGCSMAIDGGEQVRFDYNLNDISTGTGFTRLSSSASITRSAIQLAAVAFDANSATGNMQINATQEVVVGGSSPLSGTNNPPQDWRVANSGFAFMTTNDRIYAQAAWNRQLSATELARLYTALKTLRFTSLP